MLNFFCITSCISLLQGRHISGFVPQLSPGSSSTLIESSSSYTNTNNNTRSFSVASEVCGLYQNQSSPGSIEVSSEVVINGIDHSSSPELEVSQALRRLEEQLSLNDDSINEMGLFPVQDEKSDDFGVLEYERQMNKQEECAASLHGLEYISCDSAFAGLQNGSNKMVLHQHAGLCDSFDSMNC